MPAKYYENLHQWNPSEASKHVPHTNNRKYAGHAVRVQKLLDAYQTRTPSLEFRHKALLSQKKHNYQLEYDKIRGELSRKLLPGESREHLLHRKVKLAELGAKAINHIPE